MSERFRIADVEIFALGEGECLVRRAGHAPIPMKEQDARLLSVCGNYRSLDEHARAWAEQQDRLNVQQAAKQSPRWLARVLEGASQAAPEPPAKLVAQARATLEALAEQGLLWTRSSFPHGPGEAAPVPIAALGFTTRRRVPELRRALESYLFNFQSFERAPEVVVIDDSRTPADEAATEEMLRELQSSSGFAFRFAGLAERESYADELAREAGLDAELTRFALLGQEGLPITTGSARNSLLLDCGGTRYVLADDDGVCKLVQSPGAQPGLDVTSRGDPTQFWYYESRDSLHGALDLSDRVDLFGLHESLLGRPVASLVDEGANLSGASPAFEGRLRRHGAVVRTSMAGVVGDSGVASTAYLSAEPRSRARLTASEEFYYRAVESRQMLRAPQRTTIAEGFLTMAGNLGIDATTLFPPFPPVQRNSDGIAGRFLQWCFPASCRGYLNWAVLHDPVAARSQSVDAWFEEVQRIRFADALTVFFPDLDAEGPGEEPREALRALGARFSRLGRLSTAGYAEALRERLFGREAARVAQSRKLAREDLPQFFAALHERYVQVMREAVGRDEFLLPRDIPNASLEMTQQITGRLGALLEAWPRLWDAMTAMKERGRRLSRAL